MIATRDTWRVIRGYELYQINPYGDVMRISNSRRIAVKDAKGVQCVHLWNGEKQVCRSVARLVAQTYLPPRSGRMFVWHKNGLHYDNFAGNLEWVTQHELSCRMAAMNPRRKPVLKTSSTGEIIDVYASMADAARKNYISQRAIRNRCFHEVENPFAIDGHNYIFEA